MPKVTPAHEQERRKQILASALACFARQGYRSTTMDDIARESRLSIGAIYSYFPSKEELFLGLAAQRTEDDLSFLEDLFGQPGPVSLKTQQAVDFFFYQLDEEQLAYARVRFEFWSEAPKSAALRDRQETQCVAIRQFLHGLLTHAQREGDMRTDLDVEAATELVMALSDGILMHHVAGLQPVPLQRLKGAYIAFVNGGMASRERSFIAAEPQALSPTPPPSLGEGRGVGASAGSA